LELHPFNLSWGEKRRLNLASLFSYSPSVYLFDEPFTGQDFNVRRKMIDYINFISENLGVSVISSHDDEILEICDRVFLMEKSGISEFIKYESE